MMTRRPLRMKHRAALFYAIAAVSVLAILVNIGERWGLVPMVAVLWLVVVGIVQSALLKCPHCRKSVIFAPGGARLAVGDKCRHCGKAF